MTTIAALVPMRHHSERVPGKNYRPLAGIPLYQHILNTLQSCPEVTCIAVDTDSPVIANGLRDQFPKVQLIDRPEHLRADTIPMNEILLHDVTQVQADWYLQTHSTNPLLRPATISQAIRTLFEQHATYDSLFGVTRLQTRLWDAQGHPVNHDPEVLLRTQDLPPFYLENSCIYLFTRAILESRRNRLGKHPLMFEIPADEAWDIDNQLDFEIVSCLMDSLGKAHL